MPSALPTLRDTDPLGRGVFASRQANRAKKGIIPHDVFLEDVESLSVDRLDHASDHEMAEIGDRNAQRRGSNRRFYGWAVVSVSKASEDGRSVRATPQLDNIYHADIDLNVPLDLERNDRLTQHANTLAAAAKWRERPNQTNDKKSDIE